MASATRRRKRHKNAPPRFCAFCAFLRLIASMRGPPDDFVQANGGDIRTESVGALLVIYARNAGGITGVPVVERQNRELRIALLCALQNLHLFGVVLLRHTMVGFGTEIVIRSNAFSEKVIDGRGDLRQQRVTTIDGNWYVRKFPADVDDQPGHRVLHATIDATVLVFEIFRVVDRIKKYAMKTPLEGLPRQD